MTFTTLTFLVYFPLVFALYWSARKQSVRNCVMLVASYVFYAWWDYRFCALMCATNLADYGVARALVRVEDPVGRRLLLAVSVVSNLSVLGFFKYYNFFAENLTAALGLVGWRLDSFTVSVILPAGVSFYTFQALSYTIDVYRRQLVPTRNLVDHLSYVSFFPTLVAGPIERGTALLPQLSTSRSFDYNQAVEGLRLIGWGFFKKLALADQLAIIVEQTYAAPETGTGPQLAFATLCFAFQIYCDFCAYSDIARGTAHLLGVDVIRNFDYPYFSQSITEFWRRWHISLSTWFRDYVYIPLGGSRVASRRRLVNLMATFLVSGLWHGASWNFIVWGGLNGAAVVLGTRRGKGNRSRIPSCPGGDSDVPSFSTVARIVRTFLLVCVLWVFFRAESLTEAVLILQKIVLDAFSPAAYRPVLDMMTEDVLRVAMLATLATFIVIEWRIRSREHPFGICDVWPQPVRWAAYTACVWMTLVLTARRTSQFIYFQF